MTLQIDEYKSLIENIIERSPTHIEMRKEGDINYTQIHAQHFLNILNCLPDGKSLRIIDIGVTPNTFAIKQLHPTSEVDAIDITGYMEKGCQEFGVGFKVCNLERDAIPFSDDYFDVVIFTEVLEHLMARPSDVLNKIRRVIRPSGLLIFTVPNIATLINRIRFLYGVSPVQSLDDAIKPGRIQEVGHIHECTMREARAVLKSCNFKIIRAEYYTISEPMHYPLNLTGIKRACLVGVLKVCEYLVPSFRTTIFILAKKK